MSRVVSALPALLLAACFDPSFHDPTCGPAGECPDGYECMAGTCRIPGAIVPDADPNAPDADPNAPDADPNAPDAFIPTDGPPGVCSDWTFTPSNVPCTDPVGLPWGQSAIADYNTDSGSLSAGTTPASSIVTQFGGGQARVVSVSSFTLNAGATLTITGSLPLIILVDGDVNIAGSIHAYGQLNTAGPGGNVDCSLFGGDGGDGISNGTTGGGGGGGGFGGSGRVGGTGTGGGAGVGNAGSSATAAVVSLSPLRGGCKGGNGAMGGIAGLGIPGGGGGAVQIAARGSITVAGTINAGGGSGRGGQGTGGGGGGGGSGGAALFEAPNVILTGRVCADGGGGGEGAGNGGAGNSGGTSTCSGPTPGGVGASGSGGDGGAGGFQTTQPSAGMSGGGSQGGGGGGGGGSGVIRIRGTQSGTPTVLSPMPSVVPL